MLLQLPLFILILLDHVDLPRVGLLLAEKLLLVLPHPEALIDLVFRVLRVLLVDRLELIEIRAQLRFSQVFCRYLFDWLLVGAFSTGVQEGRWELSGGEGRGLTRI